jgi:hypothetical protein
MTLSPNQSNSLAALRKRHALASRTVWCSRAPNNERQARVHRESDHEPQAGIVFFLPWPRLQAFRNVCFFYYGSPVALRLALEHPERITAARIGASAGKKCGPQSPVWDRVSNVMKCRVRFAPEVVARKFCLGEPDSSVVINNGFPDFRVESLTRFRPAFPDHRTRASGPAEPGDEPRADGTGKEPSHRQAARQARGILAEMRAVPKADYPFLKRRPIARASLVNI